MDAMTKLLQAAAQVVDLGMERCKENDRAEHQTALELVKSGAVQRLVIDVRDGSTNVDVLLIGRGAPIHLFHLTSRPAPGLRTPNLNGRPALQS